jgi:predicted DCC family thiol-disulfide oxidoreductase YuxK
VTADHPYVVFYDGDCGLCDRLVQWLLRVDRRAVLSYAALQGETARPYVGEVVDLNTMVFLDRSRPDAPRVFRRARAALEVAHRLGGGWLAISWARMLPAWLIDPFYNLVAQNRFRMFGRLEQCRVPEASVRERFLP